MSWQHHNFALRFSNPMLTSRNIKQQLKMAADDSKSLEVARRMFARRFPDTDLKKKSQRNDGYGRL